MREQPPSPRNGACVMLRRCPEHEKTPQWPPALANGAPGLSLRTQQELTSTTFSDLRGFVQENHPLYVLLSSEFPLLTS